MEAANTITLRLPKINWQMGALILVAVIAGFQTYQLARLKGAVTLKSAAAAAPTAVGASTGGASGHSGLQGMVGGC